MRNIADVALYLVNKYIFMNLFISIRFSSQRTFSSYFIIVVSNFDLKCLNLFCNNTPPPTHCPTGPTPLPLLPAPQIVECGNIEFGVFLCLSFCPTRPCLR